MTLRDKLQELYLDWVNNFASVETFASYYGLTVDESGKLIELCRMVHNTPHPEA